MNKSNVFVAFRYQLDNRRLERHTESKKQIKLKKGQKTGQQTEKERRASFLKSRNYKQTDVISFADSLLICLFFILALPAFVTAPEISQIIFNSVLTF